MLLEKKGGKKTATTTQKKSLKNDFENFPPGNVTAVFCIDLEMSARAKNFDSDKRRKNTQQTVRLLQIDIITSEDLGGGGALRAGV